jgi:penicillin-binding protein 1A
MGQVEDPYATAVPYDDAQPPVVIDGQAPQAAQPQQPPAARPAPQQQRQPDALFF